MQITIKTKNFNLTPSLKEYIKKKIGSLEKFCKIFYTKQYFNNFFGEKKKEIIVEVEIGRPSLHHQKGKVFYAECQVQFPKKILRATAFNENLKSAINEVKDELEVQIKKYKEKPKAKVEKNQREFKKKLKGSLTI